MSGKRYAQPHAYPPTAKACHARRRLSKEILHMVSEHQLFGMRVEIDLVFDTFDII